MTTKTAPAPTGRPTHASTVVEDLTLHVHRGDGTTATHTTTAVLDARNADRTAHHRTSLARLYGIPTSAVGVLDGRHTYTIDLRTRPPR